MSESTTPAVLYLESLIPFLSVLGIGGLLGYWFKDRLEARRINKTEKKDLADQIIKICTEGEQHGWNVKPRSYEHILYIANQIACFDKNLADNLRTYLARWTMNAYLQDKTPPSKENIEFCIELQKEASKISDELLAQAKKLKR